MTIVLDTSVGAPIGSIWLNVDGDEIETKEAAAARRGYTPDQIPQLQFARWMTDAEAKVAPKPAWDEVSEPGPPAEPERRPSIEEQQAEIEAKQAAAARQREQEERCTKALELRQREATAERISAHFAKTRQRGV